MRHFLANDPCANLGRLGLDVSDKSLPDEMGELRVSESSFPCWLDQTLLQLFLLSPECEPLLESGSCNSLEARLTLKEFHFWASSTEVSSELLFGSVIDIEGESKAGFTPPDAAPDFDSPKWLKTNSAHWFNNLSWRRPLSTVIFSAFRSDGLFSNLRLLLSIMQYSSNITPKIQI